MWIGKKLTLALIFIMIVAWNTNVLAAYHHQGELDSDNFTALYPDKAGTKLDACNLCHSGGSYLSANGSTVTLGSCQWCHYITDYKPNNNIDQTLNPYGLAYRTAGRTRNGLEAIGTDDSDGDGYTNEEEIDAIRFPGDAKDDPSKIQAPYRVYSRVDLEALPQHTQLLLMNATKSTDYYAQYTGVTLAQLLKNAGARAGTTSITAISPDGFAQLHPIEADPSPSMYSVNELYPEAAFHYNEIADITRNPDGWCDYRSPWVAGRTEGEIIVNPDGNRLILAVARDNQDLLPGVLNESNKLDGEGPFRVVPPQKTPCPPDQRSTASTQALPWPHNRNLDHNAGFATRSTTMIRVEPLPAGTTDIDPLEAGWAFVDESKLLVYGNIDPAPTLKEKASDLVSVVQSMPRGDFKQACLQKVLVLDLKLAQRMIAGKAYKVAKTLLDHTVIPKANGCLRGSYPDKNDWIVDCPAQKQIQWAVTEIETLMSLADK